MLFIIYYSFLIAINFLQQYRVMNSSVFYSYNQKKSHPKKERSIPKSKKAPTYYRRQPKPRWVIHKIIYFAALMPNAGCRTIAQTFNRQYQNTKLMTVSKSYVAYTIKQYHYAVLRKRCDIRRKKARIFAANQYWSMDISYTKNRENSSNSLLGIMDNGARYCLQLQAIPDKSSWTLIKALLSVCIRHGIPKSLKTDNEPCFTSTLFCIALRLLRIQHKRSDKYCPWQNGHIERLFGTLKQSLKRYTLNSLNTEHDLAQFRLWYNHCRLHQNLSGSTPAEQYFQYKPNAEKGITFLSFWDNTLTGFYIPPD